MIPDFLSLFTTYQGLSSAVHPGVDRQHTGLSSRGPGQDDEMRSRQIVRHPGSTFGREISRP
jgi:hypothetical protein